jgi:HEAT repeat protein
MTRALMAPMVVLALCLSPLPAAAQDKEIQKLEKQMLKDKDASVRAEAAWDLGQKGSTDSVPALAQALKDRDQAVRANAAASLWHLGAASKPAIPELKLALDDESPAVVENVAGALSKLGVPKSQLVPAYKRVFKMPGCEAKVVGLKGLADELPPTGLFDDAWFCSQAETKTHEEAEARSEALTVLRQIVKRHDTLLVPQILDALKALRMSEDPSDLTSALGGIQPPPKDAVPVLTALLASRNVKAPRSAARALGSMGVTALPAVPGLVDLLQSKADVETRTDTAEAIGEIGPKAAPAAVPALTKAAESDQWPKVRKASIEALGKMGPAAKPALPVVKAALKDPDTWISMSARTAFTRIDPTSKLDVSAIEDKARPSQKVQLLTDASPLASAFSGRFTDVYEISVLDDFATVLAPVPASRSGKATFTYRAGAITGPEEESSSHDCKKILPLAKVDFSLVPRLAQQAVTLLGDPSAKISHVSLTSGIFCKTIGWIVYIKDGGWVEFKLDGKVDKVQKKL